MPDVRWCCSSRWVLTCSAGAVGQSVRITGEGSHASPKWGNGSFTVQQFGDLSLTNVSLDSKMVIQSGGTLSLTGVTVSADVTVQSGGALHLSQVRSP